VWYNFSESNPIFADAISPARHFMKAESRKAPRRSLRYPAWIELGQSGVRECQLSDVSRGGARLSVADPDNVPDEFVLRLSQGGATRRKSRIVWRSKTEIGIEFLKEPRPKATRVARPKAATEA
jgi:hypothetical protein